MTRIAWFATGLLALLGTLAQAAQAPEPRVVYAETDNPYWNSGLKKNDVLAFVARIKAAVDDPAAFASLVHYPPRISINGSKLNIANAAAFQASFKKIVTPQLREIILTQKAEDLISRNEGIGFGHGELWFSGICPDNTCKTYSIYVVTIQSESR